MNRVLIILAVIVAAFIGAVTGVLMTLRYMESVPDYASIEKHQNLTLTRMGMDSAHRASIEPNFEFAALQVTPSVVGVHTIYGPGDFSANQLELFFNQQARPSGSGVIISDDGYIVTNNHVIEDATRVEIIMQNNERFYAKIIGKDPSTDLALLKIKAKNLPFLGYGNSDLTNPGEWVLAVGNPFDLTSTVTAGIISAKARNIGILRDRNNLQVESFIQTDAAVNPGNSGGALVNLKGELIGVNSAIATTTGTYAGYSFAIPANLVKKIVDDLLEFGMVQRGLLGVQIRDVTASVAEDENLDVMKGVLVNRVNLGSAAEESGISSGDVITAIDGREVSGVSELQEMVARHRPGHAVHVTYRRAGKEKTVSTILKNIEGVESITRPEVSYTIEGATLEDLPYNELRTKNLDGGVLMRKLESGKWKKAGMDDGFIITYIDKVQVDNVEDLNRILSYKSGGILVEGITHNGDKKVYGVMW